MSAIEYIDSQTLTANTASVSFTNISSRWTDIIAKLYVIPSGNIDMLGTVNGDSGSNYQNTRMRGNGSNVTSFRGTSVGYFPATLNNLNVGTTTEVISTIYFLSYANTNMYKTMMQIGASGNVGTMVSTSVWKNTAAINRIDFNAIAGTFLATSTFTLWGVK